jgi:hypothetical protein
MDGSPKPPAADPFAAGKTIEFMVSYTDLGGTVGQVRVSAADELDAEKQAQGYVDQAIGGKVMSGSARPVEAY